mmetsp:Transcript_18607/g.41498  ORF Transcript_18607/g.41498 Transcript_18607/m.41498 type:complete len:86 (+) Transcript_18607:485-742(+)
MQLHHARWFDPQFPQRRCPQEPRRQPGVMAARQVPGALSPGLEEANILQEVSRLHQGGTCTAPVMDAVKISSCIVPALRSGGLEG